MRGSSLLLPRPDLLAVTLVVTAAVLLGSRSAPSQGAVSVPPRAADTGPSALIVNPGGHRTVSLDGAWHVIVDPYENGYYTYQQEIDPNGYFKNQRPRSPSDRIEYDFAASETLQVPGDWNTQRERLFLYEGTVWYQTSFNWTPRPGRRLFLYFGAANYRADVYLNGEKLGVHEGGFTPFDFEIGSKVRRGGNFVVVKVDNTRRRDAVPTVNTDWWNYGGLTRSVSLIDVPETFVREYAIGLAPGSTTEVSGFALLDGARRGQPVTLEIPELKVRQTVTPDATGRARFRAPASPVLWTPEAPRLYDVVLRSGGEEIRDAVGFRTIAVRGGDILLNGKPIFLRGISVHEEAPMRGGRATTVKDATTLLGWAKELGCNFVRLAHYPHGEAMVRAADRMGLLVWSEVPVYWTIDWDNARTLAVAKQQLGEAITRDRNRASIILWSVANETPVTPARMRFLEQLVQLVRSNDGTRLVTAALERRYADPRTTVIDDPLGASLDVIGCNEYVGWYDGLPEKCDTLVWKSAFDKPVIMSEFGADALFGRHGDPLERWTEEFQENVYRHQIAMIQRIPFVRGLSPWILVDFRSPRRHLPGIQDMWNRKGLYTNAGQKKKAFFVLRDYYRALASPTPVPKP